MDNFATNSMPHSLDNITPICLNARANKSDNLKVDSNDEAKLLRVVLNDMKKKLHFVEKTNWMFKNNFDVKFLETLDPRLIDEQTNIFSLENIR